MRTVEEPEGALGRYLVRPAVFCRCSHEVASSQREISMTDTDMRA